MHSIHFDGLHLKLDDSVDFKKTKKNSILYFFSSKKKRYLPILVVFLQMICFHGKPHIFRLNTNSYNDFQCLTSD